MGAARATFVSGTLTATMSLRLFVDTPLPEASTFVPANAVAFNLPAGAARHVQVRRLQPGDALVLFDGSGGEWQAEVTSIGRRDVCVRLTQHVSVQRELDVAVTLAVGMPANERMDALIEKATELGAAALQPLQTSRSVLRLTAERAERRREHWQAVAVAASEQSGRTRVPRIEPVRDLDAWLPLVTTANAHKWLLAPGAPGMPPPAQHIIGRSAQAIVLSGPEGGLTPAESDAAARAGFQPVGLGERVLRADTAPIAMMAWLSIQSLGPR